MAENLNILFVEDLVTDYELAVYEIKKSNLYFTGKRVDTQEEYEHALLHFHPDIIISDYVMPSFNGMNALAIKQKLCPDIPFIMLTGSTNEETAVECMKAGADDYVIKEHIKRLPHALTGALTKASARKEVRIAQQELVNRELLLRNAVNNLPSTFTIYDKQGRVEYINDYGLILSDLTAQDAIGKKEEDVFPTEMTKGYLNALYKAFDTKETQVTECRINYVGAYRHLIYYFVPTLDEKGDLYKVVGIAYDITDRKEAEEKLKMAVKRAEEYDRLKSALLANISHEVRTPLNAIMGFSQMIRKNFSHDDQLVNYVDIILMSGNQLLDIIKEMIEISQLVSGKANMNYVTFSVNELMNELYQNYTVLEESRLNQKLTFELDMKAFANDDNEILADREKLSQVLKNLLSNAFKFTYEGTICFGCKKADNGVLHFFVRDTGIGIEESKQQIIFDIFRQADESYTRRFGGVGLGLTICREMIHLMGGRIWVESTPGKGSVFSFEIPVRKRTDIEPAE